MRTTVRDVLSKAGEEPITMLTAYDTPTAEIVDAAHSRGIRAHIGNPGSADGLVWAYRVGFDSVDTSSILQNQYFHWLEALEDADGSLSSGSLKKATRQTNIVEMST